jgi:putative glutamine amidotransferase
MGKRAALTFRYDKKAIPYEEALRAAGIEPVPFKPGACIPKLDGVAGLVLSGGTDLNPHCYDAVRDPKTGDPDDERDRMELQLLKEAISADLPVLAICRGMQLFNIFHEGGTLAQHIEGHQVASEDASAAVHTVEQVDGSHLARILGNGPVPVNSRHHQAVDRVGRGLCVTSRASDAVIEGLERPDLRFAIAVQWHPEDQVRRFPVQLQLFEAFARALQSG